MAYTVERGALLLDFDGATLGQLQRDLRSLDKGMQNALRRELRAGANVLRDGLKRAAKDALSDLTAKGQLNEGSAAAFGIKNFVSFDRVGVRWKPTKGPRGFTQRNLTDKGMIRHPVYADVTKDRREWTWVTTRLGGHTAGWWRDAEDKNLDEAGKKIIEALDDALRGMAAYTS